MLTNLISIDRSEVTLITETVYITASILASHSSPSAVDSTAPSYTAVLA